MRFAACGGSVEVSIPETEARLALHACEIPLADGAQCCTLSVPENRDIDDGRTLRLQRDCGPTWARPQPRSLVESKLLPQAPAVRLGLREVSGLKRVSVDRLTAARAQAPFDDAEDLARRAGLEQHEMRLLAGADALASLAGHRRQQVWETLGLQVPPALLRDAPVSEAFLELPPAPEGEEVMFDYAATGLGWRCCGRCWHGAA